MTDLPVFLVFHRHQTTGDISLFDLYRKHQLSLAGNEIMCTFQDNSHPFETVVIQPAKAARLNDPLSGFHTDPRYAKQLFIGCPHHFYRKLLQMLNGPVTFRIKKQVKIRMFFINQFFRLEAVVTQQPVRLIQPVLTQQRRSARCVRKTAVIGCFQETGIENTLHVIVPVKSLRNSHDLVIAFPGGTDDHLGTLAGGDIV